MKELSSRIGGFGALYPFPEGFKRPVLVSSTDGVGTKLKIAFMSGRHDTVGIDLVAMVVNDIVTVGARPLFFLDYFATGKLDVDVTMEVVSGIKRGCDMAGCELVGGETAELPGFYGDGEYDLAGFGVGVVEEDGIVDGSRVEEGDVLIGIASSGLHSNGFSLVRKLIFDVMGMDIHDRFPWGVEVWEELLRPTRIYVRPILSLMDSGVDVKAISHITGGGFYENIPRSLPEGLGVSIKKWSWDIPPIFRFLMDKGNIPEDEMLRVFNCGIGMCVVVPENDLERSLNVLSGLGEKVYILGNVVRGKGVLFS